MHALGFVCSIAVQPHAGSGNVQVGVSLHLISSDDEPRGGQKANRPQNDEDCGECNACLDKPKFGGPGRLHRACDRRSSTRRESALIESPSSDHEHEVATDLVERGVLTLTSAADEPMQQLPMPAMTWGNMPGEVSHSTKRPKTEQTFRLYDLVEVQQAYTTKHGGKLWHTGYVAYVWFDDFEPWTGYAIQYLQDAENEDEDAESTLEHRVAAVRVREAGSGVKPAADAQLAADPEVLAAARAAAENQKGRIGNPEGLGLVSHGGRRMRQSAVQALGSVRPRPRLASGGRM